MTLYFSRVRYKVLIRRSYVDLTQANRAVREHNLDHQHRVVCSVSCIFGELEVDIIMLDMLIADTAVT